MVKKNKYDCLLPWFTDDHEHLPEEYLKACRKFFDGLRATSNKPQAASVKLSPQSNVKKK